jgi:anti-sigma-K factor RskA
MSAEPDDLDLRAAEYVLGLLTPVEAEETRRALTQSDELARAVAHWESLLMPLAGALQPEPPPPLIWQRLEAELGVRQFAQASITPFPSRPLLGRIGFWRGATAAAGALAACLALLLLRTPPTGPHYAAAIAPMQGPAATWLAETRPDGVLVVSALGQTARPAGKDLELWALAPGATKPVSLGVLPVSGTPVVVAATLPRDRLQLLVSVEPAGGSPSGQPTGPVLYAGTLTKTE